MDMVLEKYCCLCKMEFGSPLRLTMHTRYCEVVKDALIAEYQRISAEHDRAVRKALWNENADKRLPTYETISRWYGGWVNFMAAASGGTVTQGSYFRDYMPPVEPVWDALCGEGRIVTKYATLENIRLLYASMIAVAIDEASDKLGHWAGDVPDEQLLAIAADARLFLDEEGMAHLCESHA